MAASGPPAPGACCCHGAAAPGVHQTLEEMDFERGIWSAALDGDLGRVRKLVGKQVDPSQPDRAGYTALHYASRNGHSAVCQFLLQSGAQCNAQTHGGATALHRASYGGHLDVARLLLAQGADPTITDDEDMTSLHKAAEKGHLELCELLLQHSPSLKGLRDRKARRACDLVPSSGALRDLLETARP
ncbi:ankyrin repeat domain-containing protein 39 [Pelodiscus sinensis]|uniref:ankyrin repeat domain-containing protein 39 n=1 Tax=Pelodiscus sinensis TaxID=13735 RepID=UPI003F6A88CA